MRKLTNWNYEEKDYQSLRTMIAIFTPVLAICYVFSVKVINLDDKKLQQMTTETRLELVEDISKTWYAQLANEQMRSKSVAKR